MNKQEFDIFQEEIFQKIRDLTDSKGEEYKVSKDQLSNFKGQAAEYGLEPLTILAVAWGKHVNAFKTYVRDNQSGTKREYAEPIEARLHDIILYSILAIAMIREDGMAKAEMRPVTLGDIGDAARDTPAGMAGRGLIPPERWPCRSLPPDQWCDHEGAGGFMGHTCSKVAFVPVDRRG